MKASPNCHTRHAWRRPPATFRVLRFVAWAVSLTSALTLMAAPEVKTLTGGPSQFYPNTSEGYVDGETATVAQFNTPYGIALDNSGKSLFVADRDNNAIRQIDLVGGQTFTFATNLINKPVGVEVDGAGSVYVLNRGNGSDGTVLKFASPQLGGDLLTTYAANLINAAGIALDSFTNIYVTVQDNTLIRITPAGVISTNATIADAGAALKGITVKRDGRIAACDAGRHGIYLINADTGVVTTNSGFHGAGDFTRADNVASSSTAKFNQPYGVAEAGDGTLVVTDMGNHRVKAALTSGVVTNLYGVNSSYWVLGSASDGIYPGWWDGTVALPDTFGTAEARTPVGVVFAPNGDVYTTETYYHLIRKLTGAGLPLPPAALPPVDSPKIGWVDFTVPPAIIVSILRTGQSTNFNTFVFNNDVTVAIAGTAGTETHYTSGETSGSLDTVPDPSSTVGSAPPFYRDGMFPNEVPLSIVQSRPEVTVKAIGIQAGRPSSSIVQATFQFKTANPVISGNNAALFTISDLTAFADMWYTTDGSDPTNAPPSVGPLSSDSNVSLNINTNTVFKIRAFRQNYQPSDILSKTFSPTNFNANKISFGFDSGEASSDFVGSPGQFFYSPVTLGVLEGTKIYSLQFNLTVTNGGPNPGPAVASGAVHFESALEKPIPGTLPIVYERIPPLSFAAYHADPPPASSIVYYDNMPFVDMTFVNTNNNLNLLGVGWLERFTRTNLYDTTKQDLIKFSQPHDTLFLEGDGKVVLGSYAFQVPPSAQPGHTYQIQVGLPSATSDGVGGPGADVYIAPPTNGSFYGGIINSIKYVTVGQRKYFAGDSAPFRWFNAGDFGNTNLNNSDVMQVFQSAIYRYNSPPPGSDFFDAMDSCGDTYVVTPGGYLAAAGVYVTNSLSFVNGLFNGSDANINQLAFGDGNLDVCDVYVTFRRSLDPSLVQFRRFWTNGVRGADIVGPVPPPPVILPAVAGAASVSFASADFTASASQTLQIPITAKISGAYPVRTLMLNLSVVPLDGSPALTSPVQFAPNPALGLPTLTSSKGNANYAATWLNSAIAGLTGNAILGTLTVQIPAGVPSSAAYAVHFDHVSASPNGLAAFSKQTRTGLITGSDRSASSWNDGIPDSWRLRYFGSINNLLSAATGDADSDGANNWAEYKAGTDPNDRTSVLKLSSSKVSGGNQPFVVRWPSVADKHYVIERSTALFGGDWIPVSTHNGTGSDLEFQDPVTGGNQFYRVRVAE